MKTEQELKREAGGQPRNGDHLLAAELSEEQNMNMLDGIPNNEKPRVNQNYVILESVVGGNKRRGEENFYWGKYYCDPEAAEKNFHDRADVEREYLREYRPSLLQSLRKNQEEIARPVAPAGGREKGGAAL